METAQSHLAFFRLAVEPFAPTADPACFFATQTHQACLRQVWAAIEGQHGAALVLGNIGAGKTMILRKLAAGILAAGPSHRLAVVGAPLAAWTTADLLAHILAQFKIDAAFDNPAAMTEALVAHLVKNREQNNTLIVDDAQNINKRGQLELLRVLLNLELPQRKLLNLVFFAQPDWTQVLDAAPEFSHRIATVCWIKPLNAEEIQSLVRFRLERAGVDTGRGPQFQEDAYREILEASNGAPRTIIHLCRNALQIAAEQRT
ncbi:MAG: AAA family ATPase, partial [Candidatus Hydrogenedentes bacterium]|nr:AAA family ATPase [Candidatus Hydrogenedentota bacterium]